jgi:hypothetical protein
MRHRKGLANARDVDGTVAARTRTSPPPIPLFSITFLVDVLIRPVYFIK